MAASGSASNPILLSSDPVSPPPAHRASSPTAVGASTSPTSAYNPSKADVYVDAESSPIPNVQSPDSPSSLAALYGLNAEAGPSGTNAGTKDGPPGTVQAGTAGKQKKQNSDPTSKPKDSALPVLRIILLQVLTSKRSPQLNLTRSFLRKRQLVADDDDPYNLSVYMLKEVICKEWPTDFGESERPISPASIRLIHMGQVLDDSALLKDCRFSRDVANITHVTVKPQEPLEEEEMKQSGRRRRLLGLGGGRGDRHSFPPYNRSASGTSQRSQGDDNNESSSGGPGSWMKKTLGKLPFRKTSGSGSQDEDEDDHLRRSSQPLSGLFSKKSCACCKGRCKCCSSCSCKQSENSSRIGSGGNSGNGSRDTGSGSKGGDANGGAGNNGGSNSQEHRPKDGNGQDDNDDEGDDQPPKRDKGKGRATDAMETESQNPQQDESKSTVVDAEETDASGREQTKVPDNAHFELTPESKSTSSNPTSFVSDTSNGIKDYSYIYSSPGGLLDGDGEIDLSVKEDATEHNAPEEKGEASSSPLKSSKETTKHQDGDDSSPTTRGNGTTNASGLNLPPFQRIRKTRESASEVELVKSLAKTNSGLSFQSGATNDFTHTPLPPMPPPVLPPADEDQVKVTENTRFFKASHPLFPASSDARAAFIVHEAEADSMERGEVSWSSPEGKGETKATGKNERSSTDNGDHVLPIDRETSKVTAGRLDSLQRKTPTLEIQRPQTQTSELSSKKEDSKDSPNEAFPEYDVDYFPSDLANYIPNLRGGGNGDCSTYDFESDCDCRGNPNEDIRKDSGHSPQLSYDSESSVPLLSRKSVRKGKQPVRSESLPGPSESSRPLRKLYSSYCSYSPPLAQERKEKRPPNFSRPFSKRDVVGVVERRGDAVPSPKSTIDTSETASKGRLRHGSMDSNISDLQLTPDRDHFMEPGQKGEGRQTSAKELLSRTKKTLHRPGTSFAEPAPYQSATCPTNRSPVSCFTCKRPHNQFVTGNGPPCPQCARPYYGASCSVCLRPWPTMYPQVTARAHTAGQVEDFDIFHDVDKFKRRPRPHSAPELCGENAVHCDRDHKALAALNGATEANTPSLGGYHHFVDNFRFQCSQHQSPPKIAWSGPPVARQAEYQPEEGLEEQVMVERRAHGTPTWFSDADTPQPGYQRQRASEEERTNAFKDFSDMTMHGLRQEYELEWANRVARFYQAEMNGVHAEQIRQHRFEHNLQACRPSALHDLFPPNHGPRLASGDARYLRTSRLSSLLATPLDPVLTAPHMHMHPALRQSTPADHASSAPTAGLLPSASHRLDPDLIPRSDPTVFQHTSVSAQRRTVSSSGVLPSATRQLEPVLTAASASTGTHSSVPHSANAAELSEKREFLSRGVSPKGGAYQRLSDLSHRSISIKRAEDLVGIRDAQEAAHGSATVEKAAAERAVAEQLAAEEAAGYDRLPSQKSYSDSPGLTESPGSCNKSDEASVCLTGQAEHKRRPSLQIDTSQRSWSYLERPQPSGPRPRTAPASSHRTSRALSPPRPQPALRIPSPDRNATRWKRFLRHRHVQRVCTNLTLNRMGSYHAGIPLEGQSPRKHYRKWKKEMKLAEKTL